MKRKEIVFGLLLIILGLSAAILIAEILLRFIPVDTRYTMWRAHPRYHHINAPGYYGWRVSPEYRAFVRINSKGYRDIEYTFDPLIPASVPRILITGDSFVAAIQVPLRETFVEILREKITLKEPVQVVSMGVNGWSPIIEKLYIEDTVPRMKPDILILFLCGNDLYEDLKYYNKAETDSRGNITAVPYRKGDWPGCMGFPLDNMRLFSFAKNLNILRKWSRASRDTGLDPNRIDWNLALKIAESGNPETVDTSSWDRTTAANTRKALEIFSKDLKAIRDICRDNNTRLLTVVLSSGYKLNDSPDLTVVKRIYTDILDEMDIEYIDILPVMKRHYAENPVDLYYPEDGHFTPEGHKLVAETLYDWIENNTSILKQNDRLQN